MHVQLLSSAVFHWIKYSEDNSTMATIKVKQIKSRIHAPKDQKSTLDALGLKKLYRTVEVEDNPVMRGMLRKVSHLVEIVEQ